MSEETATAALKLALDHLAAGLKLALTPAPVRQPIAAIASACALGGFLAGIGFMFILKLEGVIK